MYRKEIDNEQMSRYFSGTATAEEQRQLLEWINENPDNERELFVLKDIYEASIYESRLVEAQTESGWLKLKETVLIPFTYKK